MGRLGSWLRAGLTRGTRCRCGGRAESSGISTTCNKATKAGRQNGLSGERAEVMSVRKGGGEGVGTNKWGGADEATSGDDSLCRTSDDASGLTSEVGVDANN